MKSKKIVFGVLALATMVPNVTAQKLDVQSIEVEVGKDAELVVTTENMTSITALQFNISLPDGITLDEANITKGNVANNHELVIRPLANGDHLFVLYNMDQELIANGELLRIPVKAGSTVITANGKFYTIHTATKDAISQKCTDVSFSVTVTPSSAVDEIKLEEGWNWISHNRAASIKSTDFFRENVQEAKSQMKGIIKDEKYGIVGNLTELNAVECYKVKTTKADTEPYQLTGDLFDAEANAITLKEGWNWMGYPMATATTIEDALKGFSPKENDMIVDQEDFSSYFGGSWIGTLTKLVPGNGYMYKSGETKSVHFNSKAEAKMRVETKGRTESEENHWSCDIHKYPNRMPAIVSLYIKDVEADVNDYDVAAFCGDECRGAGKVVKGVVMMNMCGEGDEIITFKAIDKKSGIVMEIKESVPFSADVLGEYTEPFRLTLSGDSASGIEIVHSSQFAVDNEIIYNVAGQRAGTLQQGVNIIRMKDGKTKKVQVK